MSISEMIRLEKALLEDLPPRAFNGSGGGRRPVKPPGFGLGAELKSAGFKPSLPPAPAEVGDELYDKLAALQQSAQGVGKLMSTYSFKPALLTHHLRPILRSVEKVLRGLPR